MVDLTYYAAKIEECRRLVESSNDPLYRDVYQAMADEFAEKYAAVRHTAYVRAADASPPSPLIYQIPASGPAEVLAAAAAPSPNRSRRKRGALALRTA